MKNMIKIANFIHQSVYNCHSVMMDYNLPMIQGLWLIKILCKGVLLRKDVVAGLPSLHKLPQLGNLWFHKIIVHPSKIKGDFFLIGIKNLIEQTKEEDGPNFLPGSQVHVGYPILWEGKVTAISETLFNYNLNPHFQCFCSSPNDGKAWKTWNQNAHEIE
ncbi:uncharacterized protein VP01_2102g3 [Puccinia sorghi]|uniref:5'-3' exoribonuclease 1 D1 domain-containing protein n=1 Tax=Puccinia sorghi TaxID=27349 RepID=A0A0L6VA88_9BASI|nr:uncharacterized protein VP01_2102g3 [Puccinia sorghi]